MRCFRVIWRRRLCGLRIVPVVRVVIVMGCLSCVVPLLLVTRRAVCPPGGSRSSSLRGRSRR